MSDDTAAPGLGSRIATLRERRGLDQTEFAAIIGKKRRTVQGWEGDKTKPPRREVARLGRVFGVDSGWLWTGKGTPPPWAGADPEHDARELLDFFRQVIEAPSDEADRLLRQLLSIAPPPPGTPGEGEDRKHG